MKKNHYHTLKIIYSATQEDIKAAYRKLAMEYHPDRNNGKIEFENKFKEINEAYSILSDIVKKKSYDDTLEINTNKNKQFYSDFYKHSKPEPIQTFIINVDFWESITGFKKNVSFDFKTNNTVKNVVAFITLPGLMKQNDIFKINFENSYFNIKVNIINNTNFKRDNYDLISTIDIPLTIALLGGSVKFNCPIRSLTINVSDNIVQGSVIKISNAGLSKDIFVGDLILTCNIIIPKNLSHKQKELIIQFENLENEKKSTLTYKIKSLFS